MCIAAASGLCQVDIYKKHFGVVPSMLMNKHLEEHFLYIAKICITIIIQINTNNSLHNKYIYTYLIKKSMYIHMGITFTETLNKQ